MLIEQSEKRQKANELLGKDDLNDEGRAELETLTTRLQQIEVEYRAALAVEGSEETETRSTEPDAEHRERIELRSKARLTNYLLAAARGRLVDGAEAELAAAAGVTGIPLELWEPAREEQRSSETRAVTPAPSTTGVNLAPIQPALFAPSIVPRLGIDMPQVPSGTYATGTITTSATAAPKAKGDAIAATAQAITVATTGPKRVSARLELLLEDVAAVGTANFDAMCRENTSLALSDALDVQAISGDGVAPNLAGILTRLTTPTDPTNVVSFDGFVAAFAEGIDGLWASTVKEVAIVAGVDTYKLSARAFRDATGQDLGDMTFASYAETQYGGWWTNKRMPAPASNIQAGILHRKGRRGIRTAALPHWGEVTVDDVYSGAASGMRSFTMHVLLGDVILVQPDAYAEVAFKVA